MKSSIESWLLSLRGCILISCFSVLSYFSACACIDQSLTINYSPTIELCFSIKDCNCDFRILVQTLGDKLKHIYQASYTISIRNSIFGMFLQLLKFRFNDCLQTSFKVLRIAILAIILQVFKQSAGN